MRTKYNRIKRRAKFKYKQKEGQNISNMAKTAPKRFWKEIKKKYIKKAKSSETLTLDDFYNHFKTVYGDTNEPSMQQDQDHNLGNNENAELDSEISESEVRDAVFSQKNNKSCGIDFLNAELFKCSVYGDTNEPSMQQDQDHNLGNNENAELDSEISESEVRDAVFSQKNNKSCGIDFFKRRII